MPVQRASLLVVQVQLIFPVGAHLPATRYTLVAYASSPAGKSPASAAFEATTPGIPPSAPTVASASVVAGALTVAITPPANRGSSGESLFVAFM